MPADPGTRHPGPFFLWRHLNKLRWMTLSTVVAMLVLLPALHVYQTYVAAHAYDLLSPSERRLYDVMEGLTAPFVDDPAEALDAIKGTTWSGSFWGLKLSDPLAALSQTAAGRGVHGPLLLTALIPLVFTLLLGRFFCGWLCPATFFYELNSNLAAWLGWAGLKLGDRRLDRRIKYGVLGLGLALSAATGSVLMAAVYPPAVIGREIYYAVAAGGFGAGTVYFLATLAFDLLVARRGFCRYLCPGGALYALLGRARLVRIRRLVARCNDCAKCNAVCEFGLDPMGDRFGADCTNCAACIAICPTDAMTFVLRPTDVPDQGPGHRGRRHRGEYEIAPKPIAEGKAAA
ncbi:MAG: 4Fe-4S binding protein [Alphaproteobacteria bacterium]|jgi:ferredoxin-type protein NapH|nr:4Fe-4S binding protein [Alphaproteobacteria bacterium]MDP6515982.1 4Fe-4S binding protein [Alphaproteobacteria bacterium]